MFKQALKVSITSVESTMTICDPVVQVCGNLKCCLKIACMLEPL